MIISKQSRTDKGSEGGQIPTYIFHERQLEHGGRAGSRSYKTWTD